MFFAVKYFWKSRKHFFKNGNLRQDQISSHIVDACNLSVVSGSRVEDTVKAPKLQGIGISNFFEYEHAPLVDVLRTGHRSLKSLPSNKTLQGSISLPHRSIFVLRLLT